MIKDIFTYIILFVVLFLISFYTHREIISFKEITLSFSLEKTYLFHAFFSALVCVNLRWLSSVKTLIPQLGFIYLGSLLIKLVLFGGFFYKPLFTVKTLTFTEKTTLLIPLFIFLITETILISKILNKNL